MRRSRDRRGRGGVQTPHPSRWWKNQRPIRARVNKRTGGRGSDNHTVWRGHIIPPPSMSAPIRAAETNFEGYLGPLLNLYYICYMKRFYSVCSMLQRSGIDLLLPGVIIDDVLFDPCGYSMNGLLDNVSTGKTAIPVIWTNLNAIVEWIYSINETNRSFDGCISCWFSSAGSLPFGIRLGSGPNSWILFLANGKRSLFLASTKRLGSVQGIQKSRVLIPLAAIVIKR